MFVMRGIGKPHAALIRAGISGGTATNLLNYYKTRLTVEHIEKMCITLNCTPNDLFEWHVKPNESLPENHSLRSLERPEQPENLPELIKKVPVEKLAELNEFVRGLQKND